MNIEEQIIPHLLEMSPYTPIVPFDVLTKRLGLTRAEIVKLDANENPYGPSPRAQEALSRADTLHIYPDPNQAALRDAIAAYIGIAAEHILCGAGVDEVIDILSRAFVQPGDAIFDLPPTFGMYRFEADLLQAHYVTISRQRDFSIDLEAVIRSVMNYVRDGGHKPKLLFIANPNNPDGSVIGDDELQQLLALPLIVVLDEAYIDFSTQPSRVGWVKHHDNLIVLRTFSKLAGLAGLRVGYGVFPVRIIQHLWKIKQPYTPNVAGSLAAIAALSDPGYLREVVGKLVLERARLGEMLSSIDWIHLFPSQANFVLCRIIRSSRLDIDAKGLKQSLEQRGVLVRYFDRDGLRDCIRVSVGKPEDTDRLMRVIQEIDKGGRNE